MYRKTAFLVLAVVMFFAVSNAFCAQKEITKDKAKAIAIEAVKGKGIVLKDVNIIYDENGRLWERKLGYVIDEKQYPNHGILKKGFLKNYRIVFFDFVEPIPDVWVFIDKDTGDVLTVYRGK